MKQTEGGSLMEDLQQFFEEAEKATPEELEALNAELFKDKPAPAPDRQPRKPEYNPEDPAFDLGAYLKQSDALNAIADAYIDAKKAPKKVKVDLPEPDPELDLNYIPNEAIKKDIKAAASNSFGFGGNNATLIFRKYE